MTAEQTVPAMLGLTPRIAWMGWSVFAVITTTLLIVTENAAAERWSNWVVWGCIVAAAALAIRSIAVTMSTPVAWLVAVVCLVASTQPIWDPPPMDPGSYAPWYLRAITEIAAVLVLRGRSRAAWVATIGACTVLVGQTIGAGDSAGVWTGVVLRQLATLFAVQVLVVALRRAGRTISAFHSTERRRIEGEELRTAALRTRRTELAAIRERVDPMLRRIAGGEDDPLLRRDAALLEAELRDTFRGRRLAAEPLVSATRSARRRGVDVVLLDDLDMPLTDHTRRECLSWAAARLENAAGPGATIRLNDDASSGASLTFVSGTDDTLPETLRLH